MHFDSEKTGSLEVFAGAVLWGTIGLFVLIMNQQGSTSELTSFIRIFFSFLILLAITVWKEEFAVFKISGKALLTCALLGLVCQGLYNVFYNEAIVDVGMTISAVLLNVAPLCTMVFSRILFGEVITVRKLVSILVCIAGCILAVTGGNFSLEGLPVRGILFCLGSGLTYGLTSVFGKLAGDKVDSLVMSTWSYFFAAVFLFILANPSTDAGRISMALLITGFFYALIPTSIGYILYYEGIRKIRENSKVPVIASIETVVAALIGVFLFHDQLGMVNTIGIILVLASIVMMNGKGRGVKRGKIS